MGDDGDKALGDVRVMLDMAEPKHHVRVTIAGLAVDVVCAKEGGPGALQSGMWIWPAAKALCEYLAATKLIEEHAEWTSIVELGAGAGLAGLFVAHKLSVLHRAASVTLTDRDFTSLSIMQRAIALNAERLDPCVKVSTRRLVFISGAPTAAQARNPFSASLIIGTDLIYSHEVAESLIQTLVLRFPGSSWVFILCSSFRHEETTAVLVAECDKQRVRRRVLAAAYRDCLIEMFDQA